MRLSNALFVWLNVPVIIQIIHLHQCHGYNILGGMFGAKNKYLKSFYDFYLELSRNRHSQNNGIDCDVLDTYVKKHYENDKI